LDLASAETGRHQNDEDDASLLTPESLLTLALADEFRYHVPAAG
jgi:hypothetical protein